MPSGQGAVFDIISAQSDEEKSHVSRDEIEKAVAVFWRSRKKMVFPDFRKATFQHPDASES